MDSRTCFERPFKKKDETTVFKTDGSFIQVERIAAAFWNTFELHKAILSLEKQILVFLSGHLSQV